MAFGVEEFPFTSEYDSDLRAVLKYMREFEEKLTHYDDVIARLEAAIQDIDGMQTDILALQNATSDLPEIRQNIHDLQRDVKGVINEITKVNARLDEVNLMMEDINRRFQDVYKYIDNKVRYLLAIISQDYLELVTLITELGNELQSQIDEIIKRLDEIDTSVLNPWHYEKGRIGQDRNDRYIYLDLADKCPTAQEYSELGLTAQEYGDIGLTARQYARNGRHWLHLDWVFNPITGVKQEIGNVLTGIVGNLKHTYTAAAYAGTGLTAQEYTDFGVTAYQYYSWRVPQAGVFVEDGVLQSQMYAFILDANGVLRAEGCESVLDANGVVSFED